MMRPCGITWQKVEPGYYEALTVEKGLTLEVGAAWRDASGEWHAQATSGKPSPAAPYEAERFTTLKWAKWFVENNARLPDSLT